MSSLTNSNSCMLPAVFVLTLHPAIAVSSPVIERLRHINGKLFTAIHTGWVNGWSLHAVEAANELLFFVVCVSFVCLVATLQDSS